MLAFAAGKATGACPGPAGLTFSATPLRSYFADFHAPGRLSVADQDRLYVTDPERGAVVLRAEDGRLLATTHGFSKPISLAVTATGDVLVGDATTGAVTRYDADWNPLHALGSGSGEFGLPSDIVHDPRSGRTYVSDMTGNAIGIYESDGRRVATVTGFNLPTGMHLDTLRDELLVVDQGNYVIKALDLDGNLVCTIGRFSSFRPMYERAQGLWADAAGRVFVIDTLAAEVKVFDRAGQLLGSFGSLGTGRGQLRLPIDLAVDSHNRVFISSASNRRLEVFGLDTFDDPEAYTYARLDLDPLVLPRSATSGVVAALIEVPGYRAADIDRGSIRLNGMPLSDLIVQDKNSNAVSDLNGNVDQVTLTALLPDGAASVTVEGLVNGLAFRAIRVVTVEPLPAALPPPDASPPAAPPLANRASGGCSIGAASTFDPTLPVTLVASLGYLRRRRSRRGR